MARVPKNVSRMDTADKTERLTIDVSRFPVWLEPQLRDAVFL